MSRPIAVLISDLHFNVPNLSIASAALEHALKSCEELKVPLIIAGDLHDTKAIIRGEVANALIALFSGRYSSVYKYILVGNHDLLNEKGKAHGLEYLKPYAKIIDTSAYLPEIAENLFAIPYQSSIEDFQMALKHIQPLEDSIIIMHQGVKGAHMGEYAIDNSSIDPSICKGAKVISGHYHRHQTIGPVTYIGSPYTTSFSEALDGPKGHLILHDDGTFTREISNLRRHKIINIDIDNTDKNMDTDLIFPNDIVWLKVYGNSMDLKKLEKKDFEKYIGHLNFKFDKIPNKSNELMTYREDDIKQGLEKLDNIIDNLAESDAQKSFLKNLWRSFK